MYSRATGPSEVNRQSIAMTATSPAVMTTFWKIHQAIGSLFRSQIVEELAEVRDFFGGEALTANEREHQRAGGAFADAIGEGGQTRPHEVVATDNGAKDMRGLAAVGLRSAYIRSP